MAEVNWTDEAEQWLRDIHDFIAQDNPAAAARIVEGIHEKARLLVRFPQLGHRYEEVPDREVRVLLFGHYRIAYLVKGDGSVDILGVFHGALDIQRYLL
jgi:plasmid stabilization system protein ParE